MKMPYKSGYCGTLTHQRCPFLSANGVRATTRYVMCHCACHDGDEKNRDTLVASIGHWNTEHPADPALGTMSHYVDSVNAIISASRGAVEEPAEEDSDE